jgi:hypothetical protein
VADKTAAIHAAVVCGELQLVLWDELVWSKERLLHDYSTGIITIAKPSGKEVGRVADCR